jgi:predicted CXXCH cytochrome family protein
MSASSRRIHFGIRAGHTGILLRGAMWFVLFTSRPVPAQDVDAIVTADRRTPATVSDEIQDPQERAAFLSLYQHGEPSRLLGLSKDFLVKYPQSAFLASVLEIAARSSFDLDAYNSGLDFARQSLALLPENPLLLVAVADVQAHQHQNVAAIASARDALDYLDRFTRPLAIAERDWPEVKLHQQATAWFVIGRAQINEALETAAIDKRTSLLKQAADSLSRARGLNPDDQEIPYLLAVDFAAAKDSDGAAREYASIVQHGGDLAPRAREELLNIYNSSRGTKASFDDFLRDLQISTSTHSASPPVKVNPSPDRLPEYAGSGACRDCHAAIYRQWTKSGMAKMLRPYEPQNVIGDFENNNEFYVGEDFAYRHGRLEILPRSDRALFARMVLRNGRHFFDIKQSDGRWHTYPVDYTVGSKWQQAYATTLPNGQVHVFPVQYNALERKWVNYWEVIDGTGSERSNPSNWEKLDITTSYQANCAPCHTSQLRNTQGGGIAADHLAFREPGVGCEMCHGPSSAHIAAINSGEDYDKKPLDPPVEFQRISNRDFVSICAQCHLQSNVHAGTSRGELNYSSTGSFYLVNASVPFNEFSRKGFYKDGRFSQTTFIVESLERSKCFRIGQASCGTCHNPHSHDEESNLTSLKFRDTPNRMCTGCHRQYEDDAKAAAHSHHVAGSEASHCISCHMPRIMDGLLFRSRSHQIDDIPNAERTLQFGQEDSPNACLLCHADKKAQWVKSALETWKPSPQFATGK